MRHTRWPLLFLLLLSGTVIGAKKFTPRNGALHSTSLLRAKPSQSRGLAQYFVRVHTDNAKQGFIGDKLRQVSHGAIQYIPHDTFKVVLHVNQIETVLGIHGVEGVYEVPNSMKKASRKPSTNGMMAANRRSEKKSAKVMVLASLAITQEKAAEESVDLRDWEEAIRERTNSVVELRWASSRKVGTWVEPEHVDAVVEVLSQQHLVRSVGRKPTFVSKNGWASKILQSGNTTRSLLSEKGLDGHGQIVGCADSGIDYDSCFFNEDGPNGTIATCIGDGSISGCTNMDHRKIVTYRIFPGATDGDDDGGHGTHVAGTIAGSTSNPSFADFNGVAPAAKLAFDDVGHESGNFAVPDDLNEDLFPHSYMVGAKIHSNSWGSWTIEYDEETAEVDRFTQAHDDFLVLFASGNSGPDFITTEAPATAKNLLSVTASLNAPEAYDSTIDAGYSYNYDYQPDHYVFDGMAHDTQAWWTSKGPAADGRFKPDIICPGENIMSADSDADLGSMQCSAGSTDNVLERMGGSSMATPACAGGAALARQYFQEGHSPTGVATPEPSAALVKAVLLHSGQPVWYFDSHAAAWKFPSKLPHTSQGYGLPDLSKTLAFDDSNFVMEHFEDTVGLGSSECYAFDVSSGSEFKATLAWMDFESTWEASYYKNIIQDLDLTVITPAGEHVMGNMLDGGVTDHLNTNEQVFIADPAPGVYTVQVAAHALPMQPTNNFSLVVTGPLGMTRVACPTFSACPGGCSGNGQCMWGKCYCEGGFKGESCATAPSPLVSTSCQEDSHTFSGGLFSWETRRVKMGTNTAVVFRSDPHVGDEGHTALWHGFLVTHSPNNKLPGKTCVREGYKTMRNRIGVIGTPSYARYRNDAVCQWKLQPKRAKTISLWFKRLDMEWDFDFVYVEICNDKACSDTEPVAGSPFTGSDVPREEIFIPGKRALVTMVSDDSVKASGFELLYASDQVVSRCEPGVRQVVRTPGVITVGNDYPADMECAWEMSHKRKRIKVEVESMHIEPDADELEISTLDPSCTP